MRRSLFSHVHNTLLAALFALAGAADFAQAELDLASPFGQHMVLQRDTPLRVWGTADAGADIRLQLDEQTITGNADANGKWSLELKPQPAGGPYTLVAKSGDKSRTIEDVLVGDVWLCAGQSNMQMTLRESDGADDEKYFENQLRQVRLLTVPKKPAGAPANTFDAQWAASGPDKDAHFSAVAIEFVRGLRDDSALADVPIGLIDISCGGTAAEAWISRDTLDRQFKPDDLLDSMFGMKPSQLYNGMVAPLAGLNAKGVLWYQGESNVPKASIYRDMLTTLIGEWRETFRDPELPFLIVQLPNFPGHGGMESFVGIREAQAQVAETVRGTALAVTIDTPDGYDLHPRHKRLVGRRLALLARHKVYGESIISSGPEFEKATVDGESIRVDFLVDGSKLVNPNPTGALRGFAVAGEDGRYYNAIATLAGDNSVTVRSVNVVKPLTVRYAWSSYPDADLYNDVGLPAAPFRTDTLPATDAPEIYRVPAVRRVATARYVAEITGAGVLSSLVVDGHQFIANDGGDGVSLDGFFGPRTLFEVLEIAPNEIAYTDRGARIVYRFESDRVVATIWNQSGEEITARLNLGSAVSIGDERAGEAFVVARDGTTCSISGVKRADPASKAARFEVRIPAGDQATIVLQLTAAASATPGAASTAPAAAR